LIFTLFSVNILGASGIFGSDFNVYYGSQAKTISDSISAPGIAPQNDEALSYPELAISAFGLLVRSLVVMILIFAYSTFLLPIFLSQLGLPIDITAPITTGVWISYIIGYSQYKARSTLQGTE